MPAGFGTKAAPAGRAEAGWGPTEGYFQFDQAGVHHGTLLAEGPAGSFNPMQVQMIHWLETGRVVDPVP